MVCQTWTTTFETLAKKDDYKKALQGFLWLSCSTQFPQNFCKFTTENFVTQVYAEIFQLMLSQNFVCGFLFDFCGDTAGETYFDQLYVEKFQNDTLASKPTTGPPSKNIQLDYFYELLQPDSPATFKVLFLSDIELDLDYVEGKSTDCPDFACCHAKDEPQLDSEKASKYGSKNCYHSLDGFKRMIDSINYFNTSNAMNIKSIIFSGGAVAPVPEYLTN